MVDTCKRFALIAALSCLVVFQGFLLTSKRGRTQPTIREVLSTREFTQGKVLKKFAYMTQTESCLYDYLKSPQAIGDAATCQCDVLVLSYRQRCNETSLSHVQYTFKPNTTWTTGRNLLYRTIKEREQRYLYYTFLDDDIVMEYRFNPEKISPWRAYERDLLKARPLIGVAWHGIEDVLILESGCGYPKQAEFLPYAWYDALFNSFHYTIMDYLLPYCAKYDDKSIWHSQVYMIVKTDIMYSDQVFHHRNVRALNPMHRPYKRGDYNSSTVELFVADLTRNMPVKYQELLTTKFQHWVADIGEIEFPKNKICTHMSKVAKSAVPYAHLD